MIECVRFNTIEKAQQCFSRLGSRGCYLIINEYNGKTISILVYYFTKGR